MIKKFEDNYLLGCIKYKGIYNFYLMPIAWWILNYKKYNPGYNPREWKFVYRNNILNVENDKIDQFINVIDVDKVNLVEFKDASNNLSSKYKRIYFFIDFDKKKFINGFIDIEDYLPNNDWYGEFGSPIDYIPNELKELFC